MNFLMQWIMLHALTLLLAYPLAVFGFRIFNQQQLFSWERPIFQRLNISTQTMNWHVYLVAFLQFQLLGFLSFYFLERIQSFSGKPIPAADAFQQAASFITNTNWQVFYGESAWNMPLRLCGVITQNFFSAASGLVVLVVFARAWSNQQKNNLGNFWVDIWRSIVYLLLPLSTLFALLLVWQGVPQNFSADLHISQYQSASHLSQQLPLGPLAAEVSIKVLGTNGGSYTSANAAHPLENPTPLTHLLQMMAMLLFPVMGCFLFAKILGKQRYGWVIWGVMWVLASLMSFGAYFNEGQHLLGKDWRMGVDGAVMWHAITTATATGSTAAIIDHFQPLTTGFYLFLMNLGEIAYGGVGMGVVNLLFVFILSAFIMCLLTGSAPNFLGKKLALPVIKLSMFYIVFCPLLVLWVLYVLMSLSHGALSTQFPSSYLVTNWWYALSSWVNNNGSAMTGYAPMGDGMKYISGMMMLAGRYIPIMLAITVAGTIAEEKVLETSQDSFALDSLLFCMVSMFVILIVTLLAFLPLWSLGPLVEQGLIL